MDAVHLQLYIPCKDKNMHDEGSRPMTTAAILKMGRGNRRRVII